jgi:hypothetical protein
MKTEEITAEKLYSLAMSTESAKVKEQLDSILSKLCKAAEDSAFSITINTFLLPGTVKELERRHFKIEHETDRNQDYIVISFRNGGHITGPVVGPFER